MIWTRALWRVAAAGVLLFVASCGNDDEDNAPCPQARVLSEPAELTRFADGAGRDLTDIAFKAYIVRVLGECDYDEDGGEVDAELTVIIDVLRGPANPQGVVAFSYFVAVSEYTEGGGATPAVLGREAFTVKAAFEEGKKGLRYKDVLDIKIPRPDDRDVRNYVLFLGIALTPEEMAYNKKGRLP